MLIFLPFILPQPLVFRAFHEVPGGACGAERFFRVSSVALQSLQSLLSTFSLRHYEQVEPAVVADILLSSRFLIKMGGTYFKPGAPSGGGLLASDQLIKRTNHVWNSIVRRGGCTINIHF